LYRKEKMFIRNINTFAKIINNMIKEEVEEEKEEIDSIIENNIEETIKTFYKRNKQTYFDGKVTSTNWIIYK